LRKVTSVRHGLGVKVCRSARPGFHWTCTRPRNIAIEGDTLTIRGELRPPLENVEYLFQERLCGAFSRTLTLNVPVDADKAEAVFENGVLTLTLPKAEEIRPRVIKVKSK